jgi:hypothetical protein
MCENGNSRSVALAYLLKRRGIDALACGYAATSPATRQMPYAWAERIMLLESNFKDQLYAELAYGDWIKVKIYAVGPDVWFRGFKGELLARLENFLAQDPL